MGRGFESYLSCHGPVAQWLEQSTHNRLVPSSSLGGATISIYVNTLELIDKGYPPWVAGSSPAYGWSVNCHLTRGLQLTVHGSSAG